MTAATRPPAQGDNTVDPLYLAELLSAPTFELNICAGVMLREEAIKTVRLAAKAIRALSRPRTEGWKCVPVEPTEEMYKAAHNAPARGHPETASQSYKDIWKAMLAASPSREGNRK